MESEETLGSEAPSGVREGRARILHLLSGQERGGISSVVAGVCQGLASEFGDMSVAVVAVLKDSGMGLPPDIRIVHFGGGGHLRKVAKVVKFARQERFTLVHSHNVTSNLYGWAIRSRVRGLAHIVHVHSHLSHLLAESQTSWLKRVVLLWSNMRALERCDHIVAVADSVRGYLVQQGIDPLKIDVIHNAVDPARIEAESREACQVAASVGDRKRRVPRRSGVGTDDCFVVASIGRLSPVKDHRLLIEAARIVLEQAWVLFVVVGDGPERASLERYAREAGVAENFLFVGWLAKPYPLLSAADLIVLTSKSEGLPIAALEAMALKKPVVATRVGGVSEVIKDGVSGDLVEPGNPEAFAAALLRMLADGERRRSYGLAGREIVANEFSRGIMVRRMAHVYRSLMTRVPEGVPQVAGP
jgi:glycosyltransferase involved in cell wall biosynthesis